jgi:ABC-type transport system involved in multi-copper enzyme maturation permease subunit
MNFLLNKQQVKKELRPLLLPWSISVIAGGLIGFRPLVEGSGAEGLLLGLAGYGFLGGLTLLTTNAFGLELQERTFSLLLSQPYSRSRLWGQKLLLVTAAILAAALTETALLACVAGCYPNDISNTLRRGIGDYGLALGGMFLLATTCSCAFWTLVAGSTLGGVVFTVSGQFVATLVVAFVVSRAHGYYNLVQDDQTFIAMLAAGLVYSLVFLYLGWRKFTRLELRATNASEGSHTSNRIHWTNSWLGFLVSRRTGRVPNLMRKELRLQKTIFQLAAVYTFCWLVTLALQVLRPNQDIKYLFDILTCLYAPVASLLAGCLSLGEEKALDMTASQLALPFSPGLQWLVKLAMSAFAAAALSLALPVLLFWTTGAVLNLNTSGLIHDDGMVALAGISGLMFLLGFWAISLTTNTLRAALVAVCAVVLLPVLAVLGSQFAFLVVSSTSSGHTGQTVALMLRDTTIAAIILVLGQSLAQFRKSEERRSKLFFYSITLGSLVLFVSFWATCFG